jgi:hypothetical protein
MRVKIGPYRNWVGPYQLADLLQKVGVSKDKCHDIGEWLSDKTPLNGICKWFDKHKHRKVKIHIDKYDTWNMDKTLALIVLPMLKKLKKTKHGAPFVDDTDVPEHIRSTNAKPKENEWDTDGYHFDRWDWVLDDMIWAFEQLQPDCNWESLYHSGVSEIEWVETEKDYVDPDTGKKEKYFEMKRGPRDSHKFDAEGYKSHSERIDKGLLLFGKYYRHLWD